MRAALVVHVTGMLVRLFAATLLVPAAVAALYREWSDAGGFLLAAAVSIGLGVAMRRAGGTAAQAAGDRLRRIEGLAVVALTWLLLALLAAIPFVWAGLGPIDAVFESMSGLTTTGATVIADFGAF